MSSDGLELSIGLELQASNGGLFLSRGVGTHPTRVIGSFELIFVKRGVLEIREGETGFAVQQDETLILWPGRKHGGTVPYPPDLRFFWVHFTLAPDGPPAGGLPLSVPQHARIERPDHLTNLFRRLLDDQEAFGVRPLPASLLILLMLCEVTASRPASARSDGAAQLLAARADTLILSRFNELLSASSIAADLGCNPDYLGRVYRSTHGRTLTEAIHDRRIRHATRLLAEGRETIDEVARQCGFEDAGYFRRLFKRMQGMTPHAYRRLYVRVHVNTS
ncbi:MAG: AraC family transcriptional regulator [Anaeromyxobacter sp.]